MPPGKGQAAQGRADIGPGDEEQEFFVYRQEMEDFVGESLKRSRASIMKSLQTAMDTILSKQNDLIDDLQAQVTRLGDKQKSLENDNVHF